MMTTEDGFSLNSGFTKILCTPEKPLFRVGSLINRYKYHKKAIHLLEGKSYDLLQVVFALWILLFTTVENV